MPDMPGHDGRAEDRDFRSRYRKAMHAKHAAQPLAATKTGRHTCAAPRCSARSVCADASLAMRAPASVRGTAKQEFQRRCSKAMHAEHADGDWAAAPPVTRCRQRVSVDIECVIDGLGATRKHQRVLRASPSCICVGFYSVLRRGPRFAGPYQCSSAVKPLLRYGIAVMPIIAEPSIVLNGPTSAGTHRVSRGSIYDERA